MTNCQYEQYDEKTTRITGQKFVPISGDIKVKIEGSGKLGEKYIGIAGIRDPYTIQHIDKVIELTKDQVKEEFPDIDYYLNFHIYGKNGVMGDMEPIKEIKSHELCLVVEGIAETKELAEAITLMGTRQIFYARLPEVKGTAGTASFIVDEVLPTTASYSWTINHTLPVKDPMELFSLHMVQVNETIKA